MANVVVKLKIMPDSPETDLGKIADEVKALIEANGDHFHSKEEQPIAFGLSAILIVFLADEKKGDTEPLEKKIAEIDHVQSVEVIDVRRAFG